jgi:hypothetical protein
VVWVAGSAQPQTEVVAASDGALPWAFLAIEKDVSHFGLAELALPREADGDAQVSWRMYENGIDLSPVAAARVCGRLLVAFVRPLEAKPNAPQELVLSRAGEASGTVVARAGGFAGVSLAAAGKGGLLSYVADRRTWARSIGCP